MYSMKTKICNKCKEEKSYDCFGKALDCVGGVRAVCKECMRADDRIKYQLNRETILPIKNQKQKEYYLNNTEKVKEYAKDYYHKNKVLKGRPEKKVKEVIFREKKPPKSKSEIWKSWYDRNKERLYAKRQTEGYKIKNNLYKHVNRYLKGKNKSQRTVKLLGSDMHSYKEYLECLFEDGMSWENYGKGWHIDHIIPTSLFNLENAFDQARAFNFRNTRPMFAKENISKGNRSSKSIFDILGYEFAEKIYKEIR
jgi:hypothetical protein